MAALLSTAARRLSPAVRGGPAALSSRRLASSNATNPQYSNGYYSAAGPHDELIRRTQHAKEELYGLLSELRWRNVYLPLSTENVQNRRLLWMLSVQVEPKRRDRFWRSYVRARWSNDILFGYVFLGYYYLSDFAEPEKKQEEESPGGTSENAIDASDGEPKSDDDTTE